MPYTLCNCLYCSRRSAHAAAGSVLSAAGVHAPGALGLGPYLRVIMAWSDRCSTHVVDMCHLDICPMGAAVTVAALVDYERALGDFQLICPEVVDNVCPIKCSIHPTFCGYG